MMFANHIVVLGLVLGQLCISVWALPLDLNNYELERKKILKSEEDMAFGSNIVLDDDEKLANQCLMAAKYREIDDAFHDPTKFLPAKNFLKARKEIEQSEVFQIIRKMPKGGVLHAHSTALVSYEFFRDNALNEDHLHMCEQNGEMSFRFTRSPDNSQCDWKLVKNLRQSRPNLDSEMMDHLMMHESNPSAVSDNINVVWNKFLDVFAARSGLIKYRPVFEKYIYHALQQLYDDNVMFIELRISMSTLYDLDGRVYTVKEFPKIYLDVINKFKETHADFIGMKAIFTVHRTISSESLGQYFETYRQLKREYPDFVKGFDLVNQEDIGQPLKAFVGHFLKTDKESSFLFHAGETNWNGFSTDENLVDAVLLHTKRIGHGYALLKHPKVMELVEKEKIAIEINPISNQVLKLVEDMRNHPGNYFFAKNFPVVVSNDDPGFWNAKGLSHDFYEAFIGMMSRNADLRALKQLAINSITYSTLSQTEKQVAFKLWKRKWAKFIERLASNGSCSNIRFPIRSPH